MEDLKGRIKALNRKRKALKLSYWDMTQGAGFRFNARAIHDQLCGVGELCEDVIFTLELQMKSYYARHIKTLNKAFGGKHGRIN